MQDAMRYSDRVAFINFRHNSYSSCSDFKEVTKNWILYKERNIFVWKIAQKKDAETTKIIYDME